MPEIKRRDGPTGFAPLFLAILIALGMTWELEYLIRIPDASKIYDWIKLGEVMLAGAVMARIDWKENKWYGFLVAILAWVFLVSAFRSMDVLTKTKAAMFKGVMVCLLCPAVGMLISGQTLKRYLKVFLAVWTLIYFALSIAGIYSVLNSVRIYDLSHKYYIGFSNGGTLRLWDGHQNTTGAHVTLAIMMSLIGAALFEKKWIKALFVVAVLPMFICLALTGSRTSGLTTGFGISVAIVLLLQEPFKRLLQKNGLRVALSLLLTAGLSILIGILGTSWTRSAVNQYMTGQHKARLIPAAMAEEAEEEEESAEIEVQDNAVTTARERAFLNLDDIVTIRDVIWSDAMKTIQARPIILLTGTSVPMVMKDIEEVTGEGRFSHVHNILLQTLVETGIPGLLLYCTLLFLVFRGILRLFRGTSVPMWQRFLALPVLCVFIIENLEALSRISAGAPHINILYTFFGGLILVLSGSLKQKTRPNHLAQ